MIEYHKDENILNTASGMTLFISLMLVLLTLFIFLTTFTETDKSKIQIFRRHFRESLLMPHQVRKGAVSVIDIGGPVAPVTAIINRMKSEGVNKKLMDDFLTLNQIKDLQVMDGKRGVVVILPEVAYFKEDTADLTPRSLRFLKRINYLVDQLPYLVEIKGYSTSAVPPGFADPLEFSAHRAMAVYRYFIDKKVAPIKLKVAGCGDSFKDSGVEQDKVEIIFKEAEL